MKWTIQSMEDKYLAPSAELVREVFTASEDEVCYSDYECLR